MILTKADDFPIHQTPEPIAHTGSDRNFYDRYFFNGYSRDGSSDAPYFGFAMGIYPNLNVLDSAFSVIHKGRQYNVRASRVLNMERLDMEVGPLKLEVVKPLEELRIRLGENESGITADLTFTRRCPPIEEPRFTRRQGARTVMDLTRLTQNGLYRGWIRINGEEIAISPDSFWGTRDRSWGVRPVGEPDTQTVAPAAFPQFYWLWSPLNFPDCALFYHLNSDAEGRPWNSKAARIPLEGDKGAGVEEAMASCASQIEFASGTRHARSARISLKAHDDAEYEVQLTPQFHFYMNGLGYLSPEWGHGRYKGELAVTHDSWALAEVEENTLPFLHIQAYCHAVLTGGGMRSEGYGALEQLIIGPHKPSGFSDFLDAAP